MPSPPLLPSKKRGTSAELQTLFRLSLRDKDTEPSSMMRPSRGAGAFISEGP